MPTALFRLMLEFCDEVARFAAITRRKQAQGVDLTSVLLVTKSDRLRAIAQRIQAHEATMDVGDLVERAGSIVDDIERWEKAALHREEKRAQAQLVRERGDLVVALLANLDVRGAERAQRDPPVMRSMT